MKAKLADGKERINGIRMTRRHTLHSAWALPAFWALSQISGASAASRRNSDSINALLQKWAERTASLVDEDEPDEDAHLYRLCADLADVDPTGFPARTFITYDKDGMTSGPSFARMPFIVIQFDLEPGTVIPAHNHVGWGFVSMGVQGEATVRNFEVAGAAPDPGTDLDTSFVVREVSSTVLYPGRTSSLTRTRANIHRFQAGEMGATFLDFGVKLRDPGMGPQLTSSLDIDLSTLDAERRLYEAHWLGDIYII